MAGQTGRHSKWRPETGRHSNQRPETRYGIEELKDMAYLRGTLHISMLENAVNSKEAKLSEKESLQKLIFKWSNGDFNSYDEAAKERILEDLLPHSNIKEL
ncbi:hypothetical protein GH714_013774 [Hevea brasiliensis]|uniref:R13L1/DRL21-like LRR repeat region domain-containing protein n=1 Tax=Hevea brasiliensis TaxID=3981 RepID=A0A6A6LS67_HEVBR|nr:hypothetical protein GH714_013774 [Hevea brasiliensis]